MTVAPLKRRSRIVFWIAACAILSAIVATALLANDRRNLRAIAEHYHITWLDVAPTAAPIEPPRAKRTGRIAVAPLTGISVHLHLFAELHATPSTFLRRWKVSGETICARIAQAGIPVGAWKQGDLDSATFECSYQTPVSEAATADRPSLFVIVRGTPNGDVANVRIKAILPETPAGADLNRQFQALVRVLIEETQWSDLNGATDQIEKLENVTQTAFGAKLAFSHEFANPRRFNMILDLDKPTMDQTATAVYFDTPRWLALPEKAAKR